MRSIVHPKRSAGRMCGLLVLFGAMSACDEGSITLSITDAPADEVEAVVVQFAAVEFQRSDGEWERVRLKPEVQVNLSQLRGTARLVFSDEGIPADQYRAIRFEIDADGNGADSYVDETDGRRIALELADGDGSKPSASFRFDLEEGDELALTVDFDLRAALLEPQDFGDSYRFAPSLRVFDDERVGGVAGAVSPSLLGSACEPALYIFEGKDADTDDIGSTQSPLNSQQLRLATGGSGARYEFNYLEAGDYTLALTCEALDDDPEDDDDISFRRKRNFEIEEGQLTQVDID